MNEKQAIAKQILKDLNIVESKLQNIRVEMNVHFNDELWIAGSNCIDYCQSIRSFMKEIYSNIEELSKK